MNEATPIPDPSPPPADDPIAAGLRGFGPLGILAILVIVFGGALFAPGSALLILLWAWRSRTPWSELGFRRPQNWLATALLGILIGVALKFVLKAIVMPLLGADPVNHAYHFLVGNRAAVPGFLYTLIVGAGFGEETFFRGWMFERFGRLFGRSRGATLATLLVTSSLFGLAHYSIQGLAGTEQAVITGLVLGALYLRTGSIWMSMIAHAAFDLTAYALIYWNLETRVAHFILK